MPAFSVRAEISQPSEQIPVVIVVFLVELCESNIAKTTTIIFYEDSRRICNVSTEDAGQRFEFGKIFSK